MNSYSVLGGMARSGWIIKPDRANSLIKWLMTEKLIIGIGALAERLNVTKATISQYIKLGMPCSKIANRWHFHLDNVDVFLKALLRRQYKNEADSDEFESEG